MRKQECEETINLIIVGDHSVGKTSLMKRYDNFKKINFYLFKIY